MTEAALGGCLLAGAAVASAGPPLEVEREGRSYRVPALAALDDAVPCARRIAWWGAWGGHYRALVFDFAAGMVMAIRTAGRRRGVPLDPRRLPPPVWDADCAGVTFSAPAIGSAPVRVPLAARAPGRGGEGIGAAGNAPP